MAAKVKSYVSDNPEMLAKWDYKKNAELGFYPDKTSCCNDKKLWWICEFGHSYDMATHNVYYGKGCPICSNKRIVKGINDFATQHPELIAEYCSDNTVSLYEVSCGSDKKAWWLCPQGHDKYYMSYYNRHIGKGCPKCGVEKGRISRQTAKFENSLSFRYPEIALSFDESNGVSPDSVNIGSTKIYTWKCDVCGETYRQAVHNRVMGKNGCSYCKPNGTSMPEQIIFYYLSQVIDAQNRAKVNGVEVDIYIPSKKIGIEYNGEFYHAGKEEQDTKKKEALAKYGIRIITIKEHVKIGEWDDSDDTLNYRYTKGYDELKQIIDKLCKYIGVKSPDVKVSRDLSSIRKFRHSCKQDNSFAAKCPDLAKQFDYEKNGNLSPYMFAPRSTVRVWWICNNGHSWESSFDNRYHGRGCPFCAGGDSYPRPKYTDKQLDQIAYDYVFWNDCIPTSDYALQNAGLPTVNTFKRHFQNWQHPFIKAYEQLHN